LKQSFFSLGENITLPCKDLPRIVSTDYQIAMLDDALDPLFEMVACV
jgi:hypothetical protein